MFTIKTSLTEFVMVMYLTSSGGGGEFTELHTLTAFGIWSTYCGLMIAFRTRKEDSILFLYIVGVVGFLLHR